MWIGSRFQGRSPNNPSGMHPSLRPNAITRQHAEADAFNQAAWSGVTAERATLTVDRALCGACGRSGGVKSMAKALGIKELTIVTPVGKEVIVIDGSVNAATGVVTPYGLINALLTAE
jgi:deoxycytidylate deaminase